MATIVQPYNDWREKLAVNVLGPIITGLIERGAQKEANRKQNALIAQSIQDAQPSTGMLQGNILQDMGNEWTTEDGKRVNYNSDGWSSAFHDKVERPMTQFDMGIATQLPSLAVPQKPASVQDIIGALMNNLGTKRFGMVDPQAAMQQLTPYLNVVEAGRQEQKRNDLADALKGAENTSAKRDLMMGGAVQGIVPYDVLNNVLGMYKPEGFTVNDGQNTHFMTRDPYTGEISDVVDMPMKLSPQDQMQDKWKAWDDAYSRDQLKQQGEQFYANLGENARQFDTAMAYSREQLEAQRNAKAGELSARQTAYIKSQETRKKELGEERKQLIGMRNDLVKNGYTDEDKQQVAEIDARLSQIDKEIEMCNQNIDSIYAGLNSQTGADLPKSGTRTNYNDMRGAIEGAVGRYGTYKLADGTAKQVGLDSELIQAMIQQESDWRPNAVSKAGAIGLMQIMPATAKEIAKELGHDKVGDLSDPDTNIEYGTYYIAKLLRQYDGDVEKALWAYNAGPGNVAKGRKPAETQAYIKNVIAIYNKLKAQRPASYANRPENNPREMTTEEFTNYPLYVKNNGDTLNISQFDRLMNGRKLTFDELDNELRNNGWIPNQSVIDAYTKQKSGITGTNTVPVSSGTVPQATSADITPLPTVSADLRPNSGDVRPKVTSSERLAVTPTSGTVVHDTETDIGQQEYLDYLNGFEQGKYTPDELDEIQRKYANSTFWDSFTPSEELIRKFGNGERSIYLPLFTQVNGKWRSVV